MAGSRLSLSFTTGTDAGDRGERVAPRNPARQGNNLTSCRVRNAGATQQDLVSPARRSSPSRGASDRGRHRSWPASIRSKIAISKALTVIPLVDRPDVRSRPAEHVHLRRDNPGPRRIQLQPRFHRGGNLHRGARIARRRVGDSVQPRQSAPGQSAATQAPPRRADP